ncbi:MAG: amylo-alpha-1,6-glucosidase [Elusimicrobia bacterium]|nr:amylo-alpha-1,6-glucosidase [Elusimicrobiota bacterium]
MWEHPQDSLVRLKPRPGLTIVSRSRTVLISGLDGFIREGSEQGLYSHETRLLSRAVYKINNREPVPVALSNVESHSWLGYYISVPPGIAPGPADHGSGQVQQITQETLELRLSRFVGDGVHEDIELTNFSQKSTDFEFQVELDADFADIAEVTSQRRQFGTVRRLWRQLAADVWELRFYYHSSRTHRDQGPAGTVHIYRGISVRIERASSPPAFQNGRVSFHVLLDPKKTWRACLNFTPQMEGRPLSFSYPCESFYGTRHEWDARKSLFLSDSTLFSSPDSDALTPVVMKALRQAQSDLSALRLYDLDIDEKTWTLAAGLPIYVALYGRDALTTAWQSGLANVDLMRGALPVLARWQGTELNDWRDEQPGRMLHEMHPGPIHELDMDPFGRYYGSITTSGLYALIVAELWHWTGDKALVRPFVEPALKALDWLNKYGDMDSDGFFEYRTRSEKGVENQGWKDSRDAIVYEDGALVKAPVATCEEQAFAYVAKLHMSELLWWLDRKDEAKRLYHEASELKKRFNEAFWMEDENFFAMGLDPQKRKIKSIGSNAGHCLAAGIVDLSLVSLTAGRLLGDDLFSGWGVRTLSSEHPAYNPYSYHRGSVWPVEHGTFAIGFMRYGLHQHVDLISRAMFEACACFEHHRLPEIFAGHPRDEAHPFPGLYPKANWPQAWSSSTLFSLLQAMLGLYPFAPLHMLLVDPHLPEWLPEITLRNLHVGEGVVSLRFYRTKDGFSHHQILDKRGPIHILLQPSPWSLTAGFGERMKDALTSLLPGK